jgi:glutamate dehydrogenase
MAAQTSTAAKSGAPRHDRHEGTEAGDYLAVAGELLAKGDPALAAFFESFTRYASAEDLTQFTGAELAALVKAVYARTARRPPEKSLVEIFDPSADDKTFAKRGSVVLAVNDDIPFLYDSSTAEVRAQGGQIAAAFHPVISSARDREGKRGVSGTAVSESVIVLLLNTTLDAPRAAKLKDGLLKVFGDVHAAVRDWKPMLARLGETVSGLKTNPPPIPESELAENLSFLAWLADNHFTFLGSRDYVFSAGGDGRLDARHQSGLGLLADPEARVVRRGADRSSLTPELREFLTRPAPIIIAKSSTRSTVHRRAHMDYIGVKTFDAHGKLTGERRFVGLFTSSAYSQLPHDIPLLRRKVQHVLDRAGLPTSGHDGKALAHILDAFPRDELFQISEHDLLTTSLGILSLGERPKVRLFLRFDKFDRFVSALVFVPRERYNGAVRNKIHALLANAFHGRESAATPMLDDEALARIHYIVGRNPGPRPERDVKELESEIRAAIRTWEDGFSDAIAQAYGAATGPLSERYAGAFPASYRDTFTPREAAEDIEHVEQVLEGKAAGGSIGAHVYGRSNDAASALHFKLFAKGGFIALSECLPVFEKLGLKVIAEDAFALTPVDGTGKAVEVALQNFLMERADGKPADLERVKPLLEDAFHAVWSRKAESDGFNRLVISAELDWRDVVILRMLAKYLRQAGVNLSQSYMENALYKNPSIAVDLVRLFRTLHDPQAFDGPAARKAAADGIRARIEEALNDVPSADDDRIIRAMRSVIDASLRTSFFQHAPDGGARPYIATKLDSRKLDMLPAPKPLVEIWVYAPEVEAIHLRFGRIARGGIRWSDRAEDFRTEILSLVKAQQVKNAVIVPVGAKGGFYPKRLPAGGSRDAVQEAGISAYKLFIGAILDLTDNLGPDGKVIPPKGVVRFDDDDPYLVVAADKGTATFSDIANGLAIERNYWLGDAFASGGSRGYDHKKMGITARGAWEAVKRHFRELGRDIQSEPFTCVGVGDMSGDVFGNGMLQSKETKLLAAFDHRHIFLDPSPDPHVSYAERKRMFDLPRSSWADYDAKLISKGGGVFPRTAKEIPLSDEVKTALGLSKDKATPAELIRAILSAQMDLLFFGGIGTYIKAAWQGHGDAGDRANDALRIDGRDVRASVVGEGANLGVTQYGRIEYARLGGPERKGGRIDTDAIDNSAGVDTSDHEVNIKILVSGPLRRGTLKDDERDALLAAMTDDIAALVLKDNYDQTFALSVAESSAARDLDASGRFIRELEREGLLDRAVEMLPSDDAMKVLARQSLGLTRPELCVLLAYAKMALLESVTASAIPDDPYFAYLLTEYFPPLARQKFASEIPRHRLAREIIATQLVNRMVNLAGPLFAQRMRELSNAPLASTARGYALADGAFGLSELARRIGALDLKIPAKAQNAMMGDIAELLRRLGLWFIVQLPAQANITRTVETYRKGFTALKGRFQSLISPLEAKTIEGRIAQFQQAGVPLDVAEDAGVLPLLGAAPEVVLLAETSGIAVNAAAAAYFAAGAVAGLDRLRALASEIAPSDHWDRLSLRRTVDDLYAAQRLLAGAALKADSGRAATRQQGAAAVQAWAKAREEELGRTAKFLSELGQAGEPSIAKLSLANSQVQKLAAAAGE